VLLISARPIDWRKTQPPPFHFLLQFVSILPYAFARKAIATTGTQIQFDLPPDVIVKCQ